MKDNSNNTVKAELTELKKMHDGFCIGDVIVEPDLGIIIRDSERYHLAPKAMEILLFLASKNCETVSRDDILEFGWGDSKVSKTNITHIISEIRHALADHKECPRFIQTIPRKGYRMMLPTTRKPDVGLFGFTPTESPHHPASKNYKLSISLLKSSRLFRASAAYVVVSWVLLQVFALVFPIFNAPDWSMKFSTLVLIIGFPIVISYQWLKEFKEKRLLARKGGADNLFVKRQLAVDSIFVVAVLCLIYYLSTHLITNIEQAESFPESKITEKRQLIPDATLVENAIAVLAFESKLSNGESAYMISGLQDEIVAVLTQNPEFQVASIRATNALEAKANISEIKSRLGVKFIIEGKAKINNDKLVINSTLIDSTTGFQVWGEEITGNVNELLPIYTELTRKIVNALHLIMPNESDNNFANNSVPTNNFSAYDFYLQGKSAFRNGKSMSAFIKAKDLFTSAIELDPKFEQAYAALCMVYLEMYQISDDPETYQQGLNICQLSSTNKKASFDSYLSLGKLQLTNGSYQKAIDYLQLAQNINPNSADTLVSLAKVYFHLEDQEKSESLYKKAIEIEPSYWNNYYQYGLFLFSNGRYEDAIPEFNKVNILNKNLAYAHNALGGVYYMLWDLDKANIAWEKALAIEPNNLTYANLGTSLFFSHKFDDAAKAYNKSLHLTPNDHLILGNLADAYKYSKVNKHLAKSTYQKALELALTKETINPLDVSLQAAITRYYSELGQCKDADSYQQIILSQNTKDPGVFYALAITAINCDRPEEANTLTNKAIELGYSKQLLLADPQFIAYKEQLRDLFNKPTSP